MFITFIKTHKPKPLQLAIEDFFRGMPINLEPMEIKSTVMTIEREKEHLKNFAARHIDPSYFNIPTHPEWPIEEIKNHYHSFKIPKRSGGLRQIDAPDEELKMYLSKLKYYFEDVLHILPHNAAHAYVKGRSTITAVKEHQKNDSHWFMKLDLKDFFPSHDLEYTVKTLENIYPIGFLLENQTYRENFINALQYAFLDDKLPQGTPLSPTLTNVLMAGIDERFRQNLAGMHSKFVYTRYADDILISSPYTFDPKKIEETLIKIISDFNAPFSVNTSKTRYGSRAGQNWNLGIMLNKDNRMTIGHKQNQRFRAMLFSIMKDYQNSIIWSPEDKQTLGGNIAYYKSIDPDYTNRTIRNYETKFNVRLKDILKT